MTPEEQGYRWRQAGGPMSTCWYRKDSVAYRLFERGWKQADTELTALLKREQATDNSIGGGGEK